VKLVDGTNVYVVDAQGKTTKVATTSTSKISTTQPSSLSALKAGDTVTVVGTTGSDGTVTAASITSDGTQASSATP
jgi:K+/H+ antiporter YhaU regulatory subunit KhtT